MLSKRATKIKEELVKSYILGGKVNLTPPKEIIDMQSVLIDKDLDSFITEDKIEFLFDCARFKEELQSLTSLRKAMKSDEFKKKYRNELIQRTLKNEWGVTVAN